MQPVMRSIPILAVALLAACADAPTPTSPSAATPRATLTSSKGAERLVDEWLYDLDGVFTWFICADGTESELIAMQGQIYERYTAVLTPAGGLHATSHTMPIGLAGVGAESGEEYRVKEGHHGTVSQTLMGYVGTFRQSFELIGRESRRTFRVVTTGHYVANANGEIVVERDRMRTECVA
ncbi:MAG TPA: hypothetical protein VK922_16910 [Gemmatimonadaceae bacterium]|nr:hypothetical protein [Gemmatimonadaceae bacterium]